MVFKVDYCLNDLFYCQCIGQLLMDVVVVIFNYLDLELLVCWYGIFYYYFLFDLNDKLVQEVRVWQVFEESGVELVIFVCYMQVLLLELCWCLDGWVINIYYFLLFGFKGVKLYYQVYQKGVKLVGVIVYYINNDFDEGLIIVQGVEMVDYVYYFEDLIVKGCDIECLILVWVVGYYIEWRVFFNVNWIVVL